MRVMLGGVSLARIIHERFCYKRGYAAATGSLAAHPFDILHEYASGFHGSECPSRFASPRFRPSTVLGTLSFVEGPRTVMNHAG